MIARATAAVLVSLAVWLLYLSGARLFDRRTAVPAAGREADVPLCAAPVQNLIKADMVKPGAVVIDVTTIRVDGKQVGSLELEAVCEVAGRGTPVPPACAPCRLKVASWRRGCWWGTSECWGAPSNSPDLAAESPSLSSPVAFCSRTPVSPRGFSP